MKALLRLAWKDIAQRRLRSALTLLLLLLPSFTFVAIVSMTTTPPPKIQTALASLPTGVQARITATAVSDGGQPFQQTVTGLPQWMDNPEQIPTSQSDIAAVLPADTRLLPYWTFPKIIVAASPHAEPGTTVGKHNLEPALAKAGITSMSPATYAEADAESLPLLTPALTSGVLPSSTAEAVISADLSAKAGLTVGSTVVVIAPPSTGWMSDSGFINRVAEGQQRHLRVSGIMEGNDSTIWSRPGWLSEAISAKPAGVDRTFLALGPSPIQWEQVTELNKLRVITISRAVLNNPPPETHKLARFLSQASRENISTALAIACCIGFIVITLTMSVFRLTAEQQRRLLGLLSIIGVEPRQLSLWLRLQGVILGALSGLLGSALGAATVLGVLHVIRPGVSYLDVFTWWTVIIGIFGTALAGLIAGETSARWVAKQPPLDAYNEKPQQLPTVSRTLTIPLILLAITAITGIYALLPSTPDPLRLPSALSSSLTLTVSLIIIAIRGPRWISTKHLSPRLRFVVCEFR
ncbi:MAG: ABC transporter permease, partial [Propionibacteriaceae bacterium]